VLSQDLSLDGFPFVLGYELEILLGIVGLEMGLTGTGFKAKVEQVSQEKVDVLLSRMRGGSVDEYEPCEVAGGRLEEV